MKYILNRDVGYFKKGYVVDPIIGEISTPNITPWIVPVASTLTWLALAWLDEVKEEKSVWDLVDGQGFYILSSDGLIHISEIISNWDLERLSGNIFLTRESAEREFEIRKRMAKGAKEGLGLCGRTETIQIK